MVRIVRLNAVIVAISVGLITLLDLLLGTGLSFFMLRWAAVVVAFALIPGVLNLLGFHIRKIREFQDGWPYSSVLIFSLILTLIIGWEGPNSRGAQAIFSSVLHPLESTFFALLAIFVASTAYRAFRVKDFETFLLVTFAVIVLLGQVPIGYQLWSEFPLIKDWVLNVPTLAGTRGILLGVALGTIATALRIILGADRPYADSE